MDQALTIQVRHHITHVLITVAGEAAIFTVTRPRDQLFTLAVAAAR
jgi:hypothetical protein